MKKLVLLLIVLLPWLAAPSPDAHPNNSVVMYRVTQGTNDLRIQIEDPDGIATVHVYTIGDNGLRNVEQSEHPDCDDDHDVTLLGHALHPHFVQVLDCQDDVAIDLYTLPGTPSSWTEAERIPNDSHDPEDSHEPKDSGALKRIEKKLGLANLLLGLLLVVAVTALVRSIRR